MQIAITFLLSLLILANVSSAKAVDDSSLLTNIIQVVEATEKRAWGRRFAFEAQITSPKSGTGQDIMSVSDGKSHLVLYPNTSVPACEIHSGDRVSIRGYVDLSQFRPACARLSAIRVLGHGTPAAPQSATVADVLSGACDNHVVIVSGIVREIFMDDIDPRFCILILESTPCRVQAYIPSSGLDEAKLTEFLNAKVSITGLCLTSTIGRRHMIGRHINAQSPDDISIIERSKDSIFDVQNLEDLKMHSGGEVASLGRRRVFGKVIAAWGIDNFLVNHAGRQIVRVELARGKLPSYGDIVEAVGFPETDLYNINISRADWRPIRGKDVLLEPAEEISAANLLVNATGRLPLYHGRAIRLKGTIRSVPARQDGVGRLIIDDGGHNIPIDFTANPEMMDGLTIGCKILVSGICVLDIENWRPNAIVPRIKGVFLVPRVPEDIQVLSRPTRLTAGRLLTALGVLAAILIWILSWNSTLRRSVEKRSRELTQETVARVASELKVGERTRLAMDLHDSIVQNLTGVSMEIRTADRIADEDRDGMHAHLSLAVKTLDSCRKDLRNCLWDLRNLTLEDEDVNDAIRRTLAPHIGNAKLAVRFNVPRELFCDNTVLAILRIIRELAINAVRHGKATSIKVAGSIDNGKLFFSVADNGSGFNPDTAPDMTQGHFGLQGIRDRIESFEGEMTIESAPGKGTKVSIFLNIPRDLKDVIT